MYGMSETTGTTTTHSILNFKLDKAGFAIPGTEIKIHEPD
jgi:long-subunit acyl-CoA synthetase (AMP-forming)